MGLKILQTPAILRVIKGYGTNVQDSGVASLVFDGGGLVLTKNSKGLLKLEKLLFEEIAKGGSNLPGYATGTRLIKVDL